MALAMKVMTFARYFIHFLHDREMEHVSKDHMNPTCYQRLKVLAFGLDRVPQDTQCVHDG